MAFVVDANSPLSAQTDQVREAVTAVTNNVSDQTRSARFALVTTNSAGEHRVAQPFTTDTTAFMDTVAKLDPGQSAAESAGESNGTSLDWRSGVRHTTLVVGEKHRVADLIPEADAGTTTQVLTIGTTAEASPQSNPESQEPEDNTVSVGNATELGNATVAKVDDLLEAPLVAL